MTIAPIKLCDLNGEGFACPVMLDDDDRVSFTADADIDADGAPHAYHPDDRKGLDALRNAKNQRGEFVGVLTYRNSGQPLIQQEGDPAPGFYISTTSYELKDQPVKTQRRYLNSEKVPFIVVSGRIVAATKGVVLGCKARVTYKGKTIDALVGDLGPLRKAGEISIAAARLLGIPWNPRTGGEDRPIVDYELWPGVPAEVDGITYPLQPS